MTPVAKAPPPLPPQVVPWQNWNTLQALWSSLYLIWALVLLLLVMSIIGVRVHRDALKGVGRDTAPSIIHAQHIKSAIADMDAKIANELLGAPPSNVHTYESRRIEAAKSLIEAAKNITFPKEQEHVENLEVAMGAFEALVQRARDIHEREKPGSEVTASNYYKVAEIIDKQLLPEADKLDDINNEELGKLYSSISTRSVASTFLVLLAGFVLLAAMVGVQRFLNHRTHRILNPMLLAATLTTVAFVYYSFASMASASHFLTIAKDDAFTSIHTLWQARALAYAAKADESRYLLHSWGENQAAFQAKARWLLRVPDGTVLEDAMSRKAIHGLLGDAWKNITFEGEETAARSMITSFREYVEIGSKIRQLEESRKHEDAVELCTGNKAGQTNWIFDRFDQALGDTLDINQKAFDKAVDEGFTTLSNYEWKASIIALIIALLAFFGLLPRIQEYR